MAHPVTHAESSARRYGGQPSDYLPIHELMDSSKAVFPDNRHRALTHNAWFFFIVERIFGPEIEISAGKCGCRSDHPAGKGGETCRECGEEITRRTAKTRYVCEQHVLEDFGGKFIPTASDYLENLEFQEWMNNGVKGTPSSHRKLARNDSPITTRRAFTLD